MEKSPMNSSPANDQDYVRNASRRRVGLAVLQRLGIMARAEQTRQQAEQALATRILAISALLLGLVLLGVVLRTFN